MHEYVLGKINKLPKKVSVYLAKRFHKRRFLEIDKSETIIAGNSCF
jgi:hypothetical protein